jgi:RES domain-containing protein
VSTSRKELRERLSALRQRRISLNLWRAVREPYETLSTRGARLRGGRWNPPGVPALYASFDPTTVRAELARVAAMRGLPEESIYPVRLAQLALSAPVIELIDAETLRELGVDAPLTVLAPREQTQRIGAAAAGLGIETLIVPSVASRANNAVIFPDNLSGNVEVVRERRVSSPGRWPK